MVDRRLGMAEAPGSNPGQSIYKFSKKIKFKIVDFPLSFFPFMMFIFSPNSICLFSKFPKAFICTFSIFKISANQT